MSLINAYFPDKVSGIQPLTIQWFNKEWGYVKTLTTKGIANTPFAREDKIIFIKNAPAEIRNNHGKCHIDTDVEKEIYTKENEQLNQRVRNGSNPIYSIIIFICKA